MRRYTHKDLIGVFGKCELETAAVKMLNARGCDFTREINADERRALLEYGWAIDVAGDIVISPEFQRKAVARVSGGAR